MEKSTIDRRSRLEWKDFVNEYVIPNKPVILTDAAERWTAQKIFTPEYFKENFPDKTATIHGIKYTLKEYVDMMRTSTAENPAPYPFKIDIEKKFTEILPFISPGFRIMEKNRLKNKLVTKRLIPQAATLEIFFGGPAGWFPYIHYDLYGLYAIVTQVYGRKEFIIYEPGQEKLLYIEKENPWKSSVENYHNPDYKKYPLFKNIKYTSDIVSPGETMFIPKGYWHTARSLEPTISIAQDLLTRENWDIFERDVMFYKKKEGAVKSLAYSLYLKYARLGVWMSEKFSA
jgi:histone arginine demethylase JMJD6